ncbi:hypothetical protein PINS_up008579 [Pythium insidiosum]|nr:hypothetical protein PINS_up008579 [Pythium insidiosum]
MSHRLSQNARHTNDLLQELERDKELEVLREYLTRFNLFPRTRDPASAPIRFEELKELVKHWKLHRQRNFWKTHTTKEDLVRTLYRHINTKIIPQEGRDEGGASSGGMAASNGAISGVSPSNSNPGGLMLGSPPQGSGPLSPIAPVAPPRKNSQSGPVDSPRSRSILAGARVTQPIVSGPRRENIFGIYGGDLFSQRGDYEDGMIYLSRFRKPGAVDLSGVSLEAESDNNQDQTQHDEEEVQEKMHEAMDIGNGLTREVRLKQECAFSLYHVRIIWRGGFLLVCSLMIIGCAVLDGSRQRETHGERREYARTESVVRLRRHRGQALLCRGHL